MEIGFAYIDERGAKLRRMAGHFVVGWVVAKQILQNGALSIYFVDDGGENDCRCVAAVVAKSGHLSAGIEIERARLSWETI